MWVLPNSVDGKKGAQGHVDGLVARRIEDALKKGATATELQQLDLEDDLLEARAAHLRR